MSEHRPTLLIVSLRPDYKVVYLAMRYSAKKWTMPIRDWKAALNRLTVESAERFPT